jgi:hypothetical protein
MIGRLPSSNPALKLILTITAVTLTVLGSGLMFATHRMAVLYGAAESISGTNAARTAGAAILALGILAWLGRNQEVMILRYTVIPVLFVWFLAKTVVAYLAMVNDVFKSGVGTIVFVFDLIFTLIYGYYFLRICWITRREL